jgi:hypothetical protein
MEFKFLGAALLGLSLSGCPYHQPEGPVDNLPIVRPPDTSLCGEACRHIGAKGDGGLGCEEGKPVYNSDKPGPKDVPNETCEEFCRTSQENGAFLNPACLRLVPSCDRIEEYRQKKPESCKE